MHVASILVVLAAVVSTVEAHNGETHEPVTTTPCPSLPQPPLTTGPPTTPFPGTRPPLPPDRTTYPPTWPPSVNTTCSVIANKDIFGFDLANVKAPIAKCDAECKARAQCATYTWNDYQGGTCWLKTRAGPLVDKAGVSATDCKRDPASLVCKPYENIDFVGMDIANKPGKAFSDCCDICNTHSGCTAYAWSDHNGGTCWLKKSVGHVIAKAGVHSSSLIPLYGAVCPFEYDTDFEAADIGNKPAKDAGVCCGQCKENKDCKAYTWSNHNGGTCWMKSGKGKVIAAPGKISALLAGF